MRLEDLFRPNTKPGEIAFSFDYQKAIEAILYMANGLDKPDLHNVTHLLYFADKTSLEKHGRFICGDDYSALPHGPVGTNVYSLLQQGEYNDELGFKLDGYAVIPRRKPDLDYLSDSDIECMDKAIENYGHMPFWRIKSESHDAAYEAAWRARGGKKNPRMSVESIVALLDNSEELLAYLAKTPST